MSGGGPWAGGVRGSQLGEGGEGGGEGVSSMMSSGSWEPACNMGLN